MPQNGLPSPSPPSRPSSCSTRGLPTTTSTPATSSTTRPTGSRSAQPRLTTAITSTPASSSLRTWIRHHTTSPGSQAATATATVPSHPLSDSEQREQVTFLLYFYIIILPPFRKKCASVQVFEIISDQNLKDALQTLITFLSLKTVCTIRFFLDGGSHASS